MYVLNAQQMQNKNEKSVTKRKISEDFFRMRARAFFVAQKTHTKRSKEEEEKMDLVHRWWHHKKLIENLATT